MHYDFIQDYLFYNSGNMCPIRFHRWTAISVLAMALGRRVFVDHGYFRIYADNYICLVGRQGLRKSTAKDEGRKLLLDAIPNYPIGASVASREKLVERLASDDSLRKYDDEFGAPIEWHPMAFFINELKNFMSINPGAMVEFLTDIYGAKFFDSDTIKHGLQPVINPCVNLLACETPKWIIDKLKLNIIAGGFSRRMMFVYETERPDRITFPAIPKGGLEARERCVEHLRKVTKFIGPFKWQDQETMDKFDKWFKSLVTPEDEILEGFYEAKDVLVLKIAICLAMAQAEPKLILTWPLIELAIAFLFTVEENLPKLTIAAGRNELAIPTQALLDLLEARGKGLMPEKAWHREALKNMNDSEYQSVRRSLQDTDQIFIVNIPSKLNGVTTSTRSIVTARRYTEMIKSGEIKVNSQPITQL
jgi:hypothetical protein